MRWEKCGKKSAKGMRKTKGEAYDEKANFGRLFYGNVGGWHRDWLPGLVLDIRDVLEAFKAAVEAGEVARFRDGSGASPLSYHPPKLKRSQRPLAG